MKIIFVLLFSFSLTNLWAQNPSTEKLYAKIISEEIPVKGKNGDTISESMIFNQLFSVDTLIDCFGAEQFRFVDLVNHYGVEFHRRPEHLKINYKLVGNLFEVFKFFINPETGTLTETKHLFDIETKYIDKIETTSPNTNDSYLVNTKSDAWKIISIEHNSKRIEIDSCLLNYKLYLLDANKFNHSYKSGYICGKNEIKTEFDYFHKLTFLEGFWKTINNKLIIANETYEKLNIWNYEYKNDSLILKRGLDYIITLKKVSRK